MKNISYNVHAWVFVCFYVYIQDVLIYQYVYSISLCVTLGTLINKKNKHSKNTYTLDKNMHTFLKILSKVIIFGRTSKGLLQ